MLSSSLCSEVGTYLPTCLPACLPACLLTVMGDGLGDGVGRVIIKEAEYCQNAATITVTITTTTMKTPTVEGTKTVSNQHQPTHETAERKQRKQRKRSNTHRESERENKIQVSNRHRLISRANSRTYRNNGRCFVFPSPFPPDPTEIMFRPSFYHTICWKQIKKRRQSDM